MSRPARRRLARAGRLALLAGLVIALNLPLIWTLLASFGVTPRAGEQLLTWNWPPTLDNYREVIAPGAIGGELLISAALSLAVTALALLAAFPAAFALARVRFRGRRFMIQGLLVCASLPVIAYVLPLHDLLLAVRLYDTFGGVAAAEAAFYAPLAVYALTGYLARSGLELEEAATLDGAGLPVTLARITLPAARAGVGAVAVLVFVLSWNQLLMLLIISAHRVLTVPLAMSDFFTFERELEWGSAAAALIVTLAPVAAFVAVAHGALEQFSLADGG